MTLMSSKKRPIVISPRTSLIDATSEEFVTPRRRGFPRAGDDAVDDVPSGVPSATIGNRARPSWRSGACPRRTAARIVSLGRSVKKNDDDTVVGPTILGKAEGNAFFSRR